MSVKLIVALLALVALASASYLLDGDVRKLTLKAGKYKGKEVAVVSYTTPKGKRNVLVTGGINAVPYAPGRKQATFKEDRAGGWRMFKDAKAYQKIKNTCKPNAALKAKLPNVLAACTMAGGKHWVAQYWERLNPNMGAKPKKHTRVELHISHFTDAYIPKLWLKFGWSVVPAGNMDHLYGAFSCNGWPVFGGKATPTGVPLDKFGRNIYVTIKNPVWTKSGAYTKGGWIVWNSFLAHRPTGAFCASVWPKLFGITYPGPTATTRFRAMVEGPGVTPIVKWEGPPPGSYVAGNFVGGNYLLGPTSTPGGARGPYSEAAAIPLNQEQRKIVGSSDTCYKIWGKY